MHLNPTATDGAGSALIVIPAHNESAFIGELLESIGQYGPPNAEVIVVDNGSTDDTAKVAAAHGGTVVSVRSRIFPAAARNIGVERATSHGELLVFLDADVVLTPQWRREWLAQMASLQASPMQITGAPYDISSKPSWIETVWFAPMHDRKSSYIPGGNIVTTRTLFSSLNGFDARLETGEDVDFCIRARRHGASVAANHGFKVHHEGFPKDIRHFMQRERWHGTGDLTTFRHALTSRIVWATTIFVMLHLLGTGTAVYAATTGGSFLPAWICAAGLVALCVVGAVKAVGGGRPPGIRTVALMYVYYLGRALSMWDALRRAILPTRSA